MNLGRWIQASRLVWAYTRLLLRWKAGIPMQLYCPRCGLQHVDRGIWAYRAHEAHLCESCECVWVPQELASKFSMFGIQYGIEFGLLDKMIPASRGEQHETVACHHVH